MGGNNDSINCSNVSLESEYNFQMLVTAECKVEGTVVIVAVIKIHVAIIVVGEQALKRRLRTIFRCEWL